MIKLKKLTMTLVALLAVTTGAWATDETLLTTITPTGDGTYSETTAGAVTVTPAGSFFYSGSYYGWRWDYYGSLTVTANEGYTITRCVFIQQGKNQSVTISEAPFALNFEEWLCYENHSMDGVTSIEVFGTAPAAPSGPEVAWNTAEKTGSFTMPGGNVTLEPEYYPQAAVADGGVTAADADARATTDDPLVKVDATKLTGAKKLMYFVSNSGTTAPAYDTEGWTDQLPTAEGFTQQGIVYVWYYPVGIDEGVDGATATYSDGDICPQYITAPIAAAPTYAVTFAEGVNPEPPAEPEWSASPAADVTKGTEVKVTYTGTKKVIGVKAEKKAKAAAVPEYYNKLTKINDNFDDQVEVLKKLGRGRQAYNSSLTAAQAYALATYQAAIDGIAVYVIMSSQGNGYEIHYAVSTDASATEHTSDLYDICDSDRPAVRMYYIAQ